MYTLEKRWRISIEKYGLQTVAGKFGGGRVILLRATNVTKEEQYPIIFTGKIFSDGVITDRIRKSFGLLLPGETEEIALLKAMGTGKSLHASKNEVFLFFDSIGLKFQATSMGCKFLGEVPTRQDMFTRTSLDSETFSDGPEV